MSRDIRSDYWVASGKVVKTLQGDTVCMAATEADARMIAQAPVMMRLLAEKYRSEGRGWNREAELAVNRSLGLLG